MASSHTAAAPRTGARRSAHPAVILLIIAGAQLMVVLDATIVNIALPSMADYFNRSQTDMTWALNAYTLAFGGLLLLGGRAGDILGRRRMFIIGLVLFTLGSFLGGIAGSFGFLLFGRVVQGLGGAIASPTALSLVTTSFEEGPARTRAFAVYAAVSGAGAALGLLLGGVLTEYLTWRWVLFVNVPIGIALAVASFVFLHESERYQGRFDFIGAVLSVLGMVGIVYGFINAANHGWSQTTTLVTLIGGVALIVVFVLWQMRTDEPMMPLHVVLDRNRGGSYLVMLIVGGAMFGMFYFVTFFIQQVVGFSALRSGFAFLPVAFTIGITSQVMTKLLPRFGPRPLIITGTVLLTGAMLWYSMVDKSSGYLNTFLPGMIVMAIGMGCIFVPLTTVAVARVKNTEAGVASALLNVGQQVGGAIGLSVLATVAATAGRHSADTNKGLVQQGIGSLPPQLQQQVGGFLGQSSGSGPDKTAINDFVNNLPASQQSAARSFFDGPFHEFSSTVQAHSSGMGFLAAAIFGFVAIVAAVAIINIRKDDVPEEALQEAAVPA